MKPKNMAVVYLEPFDKEEKDTLELVKKVLEKNKLNYQLIKRESLNSGIFKNSDFILVIGGDGTFIRTSHFADKHPMFGVNCNCKVREGFFLKSDLTNFEEKFSLILHGQFEIIKINRLTGIIDSTETCPAVNEIFIGAEKPYKTSLYRLKIKDKQEIQKSSGVLIATAAGSHAWLKSAGGNVLDLESDEIQYFVREPYSGKLTGPKLLMGAVHPENIEVESMMEDGVIAVDSNTEYDFKKGKKLKIKKAEPLRLIEV